MQIFSSMGLVVPEKTLLNIFLKSNMAAGNVEHTADLHQEEEVTDRNMLREAVEPQQEQSDIADAEANTTSR